MKRRNDEGYALVFTLVVLLVLGIVAIAMMSLTERDLNNQLAAIDRMKEQYEVQGEIEKIIGRLENNTGEKLLIEILQTNYELDDAGVTDGEVSSTMANIRITSGDDGTDIYRVTIECKLELTARAGSKFVIDDGVYTLKGSCEVEYISYEISSEKIDRQNSEEVAPDAETP